MKKNVYMILSLFFAVLLIASNSFAVPCCPDERPNKKMRCQESPDKMMDDILLELGLSDEQMEKVAALKKKPNDMRAEFRKTKKALFSKMKAELDKYQENKEAINAIIDDILKLEREKLESHVEHVLAMKSILTEEQFKNLKMKMEIKRQVRKELNRKRMKKKEKNSFRK